MADHGKRSTYVQGCRCDACTAAHAEYHREYKHRQLAGETGSAAKGSRKAEGERGMARTGKSDGNVTPIFGGAQPNSPTAEDDTDDYQMGPVEFGVIEECKNFPQAQVRPAMVEQARALARLMDDERRVALWPTTSRQLTSIMNDLRDSAKRKARGRLATVQKMTRQDQSATGT